MNLAEITPLILAWNERENLGRTLEALGWASQILVIDSGSDDGTREICARHPAVAVVHRAFDSAARQANHGLSLITTEWVLSLDADYEVPAGLVAELRALVPAAAQAGYRARFVYRVFGRPLRGTLYPPRSVLYRRARAAYHDDGHTQRVRLDGAVGDLATPIFHDDRKPLARWFHSQARYAAREAEKLSSPPTAGLRLTDRLRRARFIAPFLNFAWTLVVKGAVLDGRAGLYYAFQRLAAELMIALELLDRDLRTPPAGDPQRASTSRPAESRVPFGRT